MEYKKDVSGNSGKTKVSTCFLASANSRIFNSMFGKNILNFIMGLIHGPFHEPYNLLVKEHLITEMEMPLSSIFLSQILAT